eukprot:1157346-Pelagomonas_calceolata.AAC.5
MATKLGTIAAPALDTTQHSTRLYLTAALRITHENTDVLKPPDDRTVTVVQSLRRPAVDA